MQDHQSMEDQDPRAQALAKAMLLFWSKGAEAASYNDLVAATGLSRKALYAAWPDKAALVREALESYRDQVLTLATAPLQGGAAGLRAFWDGLERAALTPGFRGCFMVNSGTGQLGTEPQIAPLYGSHLDRLQALLEGAIRRGQAEGQIAVTIDPDRAGRLALAVAVQMQTMMAAGHHSARLPALFTLARETCGLSP